MRSSSRTVAIAIALLLLLIGWDGRNATAAGHADSRAWYILSQTDTNGLLLGLPERLGKTMLPLYQATPMWYGVDNGGRLALDVQVKGDAKGAITIGFFADPRWWVAEPVQVRQVVGPGRYTFTRLIPGKYRLGAMLGMPPTPAALGVHATWPAPVEIAAGRTAKARVLLSDKFQNRPAGIPGLAEGFAAKWEKMDPTRMITVRTLDPAGKPVPFCRVTFVDRGDGTQTLSLHQAGTDDRGYTYCDKIDRAFSLLVQRYDFLPETLASRYESRKISKMYNAQDRPVITIKWDDRFPTGTGRLVGQVYDQSKHPLKEYYLTLTRHIGEQHDWSDAASYAISLPVMQPEGRFEVGDLPSGTYTVMVRPFDYQAYSSFDGPKVTIPKSPNAVVKFDATVEAKELFYGRAVYQDGTPVYPGSWIAWLRRDARSPIGGESVSGRTDKQGCFRVSLSREEHRKLTVVSQGMIDVSASEPAASLQIPITQLSKTPKQPFKIVFPKPRSSQE